MRDESIVVGMATHGDFTDVYVISTSSRLRTKESQTLQILEAAIQPPTLERHILRLLYIPLSDVAPSATSIELVRSWSESEVTTTLSTWRLLMNRLPSPSPLHGYNVRRRLIPESDLSDHPLRFSESEKPCEWLQY